MIFNELEYANKMLKNGFIQDKYLMELKLLAKYYNKKEGLKTNEVKQKLKEFCEKYLPEYNEVLHLELITKATRYGVQKKNNLVVVPSIPITKTELEKIKSLNNLDLEKLTFIGLVLSKIYKNLSKGKNNKSKDYYINNFRELFKHSKIKVNKQKREKFIEQLCETKLFELTIYCTLKVNFIDNKSEPQLIIKNFDNFLLEYLKYIGDNVIYCENCKVPLVPSNNKTKYCKDCAKEIKLENDRRIQKERYYNSRK